MERDAEAKREVCITDWMPSYRSETGGLDPTFLLTALELLIKCRHVLKMTYVYAWFADTAIKAQHAKKGSPSPPRRRQKGRRDAKTAPTESSVVGAMSGGRTLAELVAKQELFNHQQANLEGITERLATLLFEFPKNRASFDASELRNLIGVTNRFMGNLVAGFEDEQEDDDL